METAVGRPIKIDGMAYAPTNEQGVVFLFGRLAPELGFHVEKVQTAFPDCTAWRRGKRCKIEFEYRASSYRKHPPRGCDVIVCWDNDWEQRPRKFQHLEIIALKNFVGAAPRVFAIACNETERGQLVDRATSIQWEVPKLAQIGDLCVMYRTRPASEIRDLWKLKGPFSDTREREGKRRRRVEMRRLAALSNPVSLADLKRDPTTRGLGVVRKSFQGKSDITHDWHAIAGLITQRNPGIRATLKPFLSG